ncbi:MAG TPA: ABC transporter permease [Pseudoxanthomonas sp.]|uniref:Transport permease protein n=1 Tax=Pseudoxanthomonas helianthi TaxID=1453541 RepID=A0A941ARD6_9GAMM|nr:ABC transporter permease [Pseudoxanthomonas helianthi]MBP3982936.1 ABC transporter permease [Pseudoxanthomonas helianthi]HWU71714.1 ABC transporter permease [Pseudoxanthomonas sp.]
MKARQVFAVMLKEVRQMARDRMTVAMMIGIPTLQLLLFGYAINPDVRNLPAAVADMADTAGSRALVQDLFATGVIRPVAGARTPQELQALLREGRIKVGVVVPPDFERRRIDRREAMQVIVDGSDISVQATARQLAAMPLDGSSGVQTGQISVLPLYNPRRVSAINVVPGLVGVILTMTMVMFTAMAIVRERERGNLELLITTPVSSGELMVGKVLPYIVVGLVQVTVVLLLGSLLFQVPIRGGLLDVYGASMLLIVANLTLGLLVSTAAKTQFQSMQMAFFLFLPSILLSGFMFPFDGMPRFAQWIAEVLPLTHFMRLIRGIVLRGASLAELWPDVLALLAFTTAMMTLAILRFRKRLD